MNYNMVLTPEQWERLRPKMRAAGKSGKLSFLSFFGMAGRMGGRSSEDSGRNVRFF